MLDRKDLPGLFLLLFLATLISSFNFGKVYEDSLSYLELVGWFHGAGQLIPPFCYRPAIPFIASILPFDPVFSISAISMIFLLALTVMIYLLCLQVGASRPSAFVATALATVSHIVLEYGAVVLLDSSSVFFMALAVYLMLHPKTRDKWFLILAVIIIGVFFKEETALAAVAYILYRRNWRQLPIFVIGPALGYLCCRLIVGVLQIEGAKDIWIPSLNTFLIRIPYIIYSLSWGLVTFAWLILLIPFVRIPKETLSWLLAVGCSMASLMVFAMAAASFDGRFIWPVFLMLAPLAALCLDYVKMKLEKQRERVEDINEPLE